MCSVFRVPVLLSLRYTSNAIVVTGVVFVVTANAVECVTPLVVIAATIIVGIAHNTREYVVVSVITCCRCYCAWSLIL